MSAPVATPARWAGRTVPEWVIAVTIGVVSAAFMFARIPAGEFDVPWAEDGFLFLPEFLQLGVGSLVEGYAGYQHFLPRIMTAAIVTLVPLEHYAVAVFVSCVVLTAAMAAGVYLLAGDMVPYRPARAVIALITAFVPLAGQEVLGNMADLHTYAMWLGIWLLWARPPSRWGGVALAVVMFLMAATEVQMALYLLLAPLVILRDRRRWPVVVGLGAGVVWQIITFLTVPRTGSSFDWIGVASLVKGWLINVILPIVVPHLVTQRTVVDTTGVLIPIIALIPIAAAMIYVALRGRPDERLLLLTLVLVAIAVYAAGAIVDGTDAFRYAEGAVGLQERAQNARYGVLPSMAMLATLPLAVAVWVERRGSRRPAVTQAVAGTGLAVMLVALTIASVSVVSIRGWTDAQWSFGVRAALTACEGRPDESIEAVPIAPFRTAELTCVQIRERSAG